MNGLLARGLRRSARAEWRRLAVGLALLLAASAAWHWLRPPLIRVLARSSLGCDVRAPLIQAALRDVCQDRPPPDSTTIRSVFGPGQPVVAWTSPMFGTAPSGTVAASWPYHFADDKFTPIGKLYVPDFINFDWFGDWDGDGQPEALPGFYRQPTLVWVLVRVRRSLNEVAAIIEYDPIRMRASGMGPHWTPPDQGGLYDLIFWRRLRTPAATGVSTMWPTESVARFAWTAPGGILIPQLLPDDGSIRVWTAPDGQPYVFDPNEPVWDVVNRLLPLASSDESEATSQPDPTP